MDSCSVFSPHTPACCNSMSTSADSWEIEVDPEWMRVRKWRQLCLMEAGITEFDAYRLALATDLDLHTLVDAAKGGATGQQLTDLYLD